MGMKCIGVDIGGTSVKIGLFETTGELLDKWEVKTRKEDGGVNILPDVAASIRKKLDEKGLDLKKDVAGAGMGVPGPVMPDGYVEVCVNLGWRDLNPQEELSRLLDGIPVKSGNDANVAALGEMWQGGGKGYSDLVMVTLGTGVGGGIIIDGKIYAGMRSMGAELGHTLLVLEGEHCTCGRDGCWEAYASATALIRQAKRAGEQHPESALHGREELTALDVFQAADAGDAAAQAVIDRWCVYVAAGMTDLVNSLAPEMILIGGGISRQGERILSPIREYVAEHCFGGREGAVPIIAAAKLGNEAGIIGAAAL